MASGRAPFVHLAYDGRVMARPLPKQCFLALAAVGWADGVLDANEAVGLLKAARDAGLSPSDLAEVESATRQVVTLADIECLQLSRWDCLFTYALAVWMARLDGVVTPEEESTLGRLAIVLDLSFLVQVRVAATVKALAERDPHARPDRFDLAALDAALAAQLPHLAA